jgi:phosphoketolase
MALNIALHVIHADIIIDTHTGHWGTCPGLTLLWAHLNLLIRDRALNMLYVIGPGHGAPAALASLWLEGSLQRFYPGEYGRDRNGLRNLITRFSVPGGFPRLVRSFSFVFSQERASVEIVKRCANDRC